MKTLKINTTGLSLLELKKKYPTLFWNQGWYENESFAKEKPEAGEFEIVIEKTLTNKTWAEQKESLKKDEIVLHPTQYLEGIINQFNLTGERLFNDWYIRTNAFDSFGLRVVVGLFSSGGLDVLNFWDDSRYGLLGLSAARKL